AKGVGDGLSNIATVMITVTAQTPIITWANPDAITYGTPLSTLQLNATAATVSGDPVPGTFTYTTYTGDGDTPALGTVLDAGWYQTLIVNFTPDNLIHYNSAAATAEMTVDPAIASVSPN